MNFLGPQAIRSTIKLTRPKLFDTYNVNISARNITDKRYSEAFEYKAPGRSFNFMIGRSF